MAASCKRCVILDHHKTAAEHLDSQPPCEGLEVHLDMNRCGATIALDYFKPSISAEQKRFFSYIEDSDLWRWALPESRAFYAGFISLQLEYDVNKNPAIFDQILALKTEAVISKGRIVLEHQQRTIHEALRTAFVVQLGGAAIGREPHGHGWGQALAVCVDADVARIRSELGNALADASSRRGLLSVGVVVYREAGMDDASMLKVSLRSLGDFDSSQVSKAFGGGGHFHASSFLLSAKDFDGWKM